METNVHLYRGFEIYPLVYSHHPGQDGRAHNYDDGFDAAVRICQRGTDTTLTRSRVFKLGAGTPFVTAGEARRASTQYAEQMIDACGADRTVWDSQ
jgi:hypothetical protein